MPSVHDPSFRASASARVKNLRPDMPRRWGKMTVDQMLWHLNCTLENALGRYPIAPIRIPLPKFLLKFAVINLPWRKGGTPTAPELEARKGYDLEQERARTIRLLEDFAAKPLDDPWIDSSFLGPLSGRDWSRLQGKHVDHHLKQFGA